MGLDELYSAIVKGESKVVPGLVKSQLDAGTPPETILKEGMIRAMEFVGTQFEIGEAFVPEMLIAAHAMRAGLGVLKPLLVQAGTATAGKVAIGTVQGDLHDIGKNLVGMMLEGAGFEVVDLGVDVPAVKFVEAANDQVDIIAMSALLTTTMPHMANVIQALNEAGVRGKVKVMVGGAPLTQAYAAQIGADGYADSAGSAARVAKRLLGVS